MKILTFSDWRIQPLQMLVDLVSSHKPDVILYAGDDLVRFVPVADHVLLKTSSHLIKLVYPGFGLASKEDSRALSPKTKRILPRMQLPFSNILNELKVPFYFVNGNDDFIMCIDGRYYARINEGYFLVGAREYHVAEDVDRKITLEENLFPFPQLYGQGMDIDSRVEVGTGLYAPISPSFGEFEILRGGEKITVIGIECKYGLLSEIKKAPNKYADVYLSHVPPLGVLDLSVRFGIDHIGSKKLLSAVKKYKPRLVVCGHSHTWGGKTARVDQTIIVNVSSQDRDASSGNYALIDTSNWSIEVRKIKRRPLHAVPGIRALVRRCGVIRNVEKLRGLYHGSEVDFLASLEAVGAEGIDLTRVRERIESLKWTKPKIKRPITFNPYTQTYVDVETGLAQGPVPGQLWLVGIWHDGRIRQFVIPREKQAFLKYIKENRITSLASWTRYDSMSLRPLLDKAGIPMTFVDACQRTRNCLVWYTYSLHDLHAALFGMEASVGLIEGYTAGLYADHLIIPNRTCPYCPSPQEVTERIKERNKVDILLMLDICRRLWEG